jgi:FAD/FMN-containing dehydrogenase
LHSRTWGLSLDAVKSLRAVLADGSTVTVSSQTNTDLFYALRGAADSFGIVTEFEIWPEVGPKKALVFSFESKELLEDVKAAASAVIYLQGLASDENLVEKELNLDIQIQNGAFKIYGLYLGDEQRFRSVVSLKDLINRTLG